MAWGEKLDYLEYLLGCVFKKTWEQLEKLICSNAVEYAIFNHMVDECEDIDCLKALAKIYANRI